MTSHWLDDCAGQMDAMGRPFSEWLIARDGTDGRLLRDTDGRVVYETQAERQARLSAPINQPATPAQLSLFT